MITGGIVGHLGWHTFLTLGAIVLAVTGGEALYADMGHFGRRPIKLAWFAIVFPSLIINYAGQAALVLEGAPTDGNIFYRLCPEPLLLPLIVLATVATIIASQSIITGAFSMTRQAIQLGWLPRLYVKQTSSEGYGQIYVGVVNWLLMIVTRPSRPSSAPSDWVGGRGSPSRGWARNCVTNNVWPSAEMASACGLGPTSGIVVNTVSLWVLINEIVSDDRLAT